MKVVDIFKAEEDFCKRSLSGVYLISYKTKLINNGHEVPIIMAGGKFLE